MLNGGIKEIQFLIYDSGFQIEVVGNENHFIHTVDASEIGLKNETTGKWYWKDVKQQLSLSQIFDDWSEGNQGIADLDMHAPGIWCFNTGCKNAPCDKGMLLCMTLNTWTVQLVIQIYTSAAYVRSRGGSGGRFTEWARL